MTVKTKIKIGRGHDGAKEGDNERKSISELRSLPLKAL